MKKRSKKTTSSQRQRKNRLTADNVLGMRFISHITPLNIARLWLQASDETRRKDARRLLEGLFKRFHYSVDVGHQLALACFEEDEDKQAKKVLDQLSLLCRNPHEEVQARRGRLFRDQGDRNVPYPELNHSEEKDSSREAHKYYRLALEEYQIAYEIRGGYYPGINVATLHFLVAAFDSGNTSESDAHLKASEEVAKDLLDRRASWPTDMPDDDVWHAATEGEAYLLLKDWDAAASSYQRAVEHSRAQNFHRNSMRKQVARIVYCYRHRFKITQLGPFKDWKKLFLH